MSLLLSIPLSAQLLISQIVGNNGYTVDRPNAIEIFNYSGTQLVLNSNNFSVTTHRKNYSGNKTVYTWTPDSDIVLEPSMNFVLIGFRFSQPNGVDPDLTAFLSASGAQFYDTSADSLTFDETSSIRLNLNGEIVDQLGEWGLSNANIIPNDTTPTNINQRNWERKLDWIQTGNPSWTRENRGGQGGIETGGFLNTFTQLNSALAPYTVEDALGLGVSPGTIVYDGSNWNTPGNSQGSIPSNTNGSVIEIGSGSIALDNNQNNINKIVVADSATVTLGANASGYSQAKRISKKGSNQTGTIISERYFGNDGWHIIGTPFPNGFNNTQGRGVSARYWYWNGGGWTESSTVPAGLAIMVRVGSAYSYSYTGGGAGTVSTGNGGNTDAYSSFTWDRTGSADGDLFYVSDGHSSVSQGSGWNLLSNPLPCALDWNAMYDNGNTNNIDATVYIWNPTTNGWINYNAQSDAGSVESGLIPPNGAFLVKVSSDAPASIAVDVDSHGSLTVPSTSYNKQFSYPTDVIHVGITDITSSASNYFMVSHDEIGTADYDPGLDSWFKMSTGDNIPDIYFPEGEHGQIFQNVTDLSQPQSIPVATTDLVPGNTYSISVEQFVDGNEYHVTLEDTYTNSMIDLSRQPYSFTQLYETVDDRFILHINQNTVGVDEALNHDYYSFTRDNELYINPGSLDIKTVKVLSMEGKIIGNVPYKENSIIIELPNRGIYVVEIQASQGTFTDKIIY
jgi:hypothetical protein